MGLREKAALEGNFSRYDLKILFCRKRAQENLDLKVLGLIMSTCAVLET